MRTKKVRDTNKAAVEQAAKLIAAALLRDVPDPTAGGFASMIMAESEPDWPVRNRNLAIWRVVDRALQKLRKDGVIRFNRITQRWVLG